MNNSTICIIPARGGSKGLARKNILKVDGKPLIHYPIEAALESGVCDVVMVTTDDEEIAEAAKAAGAEVPFLRPPELAQDLTTTEDTLKHAINEYEKISCKSFDITVFLIATSIFRKQNWVQQVVNKLIDDPSLESAFIAHATTKNYWHMNEDGAYERLLPNMRTYSSRQIKDPVYREDTGIACASRAWLWREGRRIGDNVDMIINDDPVTDIDIHTQRDLYMAEVAMQFLKKNDPTWWAE